MTKLKTDLLIAPAKITFRENRMRTLLVVYVTSQAFTLILFFGTMPFWSHPSIKSEESKQIVELLLPLFTGQVGTIVGFYFGSNAE